MDKKTEPRASCAPPRSQSWRRAKPGREHGPLWLQDAAPGAPAGPGRERHPPSPGCQGSGHGSALFPLSLSPTVSSRSPEKPQDRCGSQAACQETSGSKGKTEEKNKRTFSFSRRQGPWVALGGQKCPDAWPALLRPCPSLLRGEHQLAESCVWVRPPSPGTQEVGQLGLAQGGKAALGEAAWPLAPQALCICPGALQRDEGLGSVTL